MKATLLHLSIAVAMILQLPLFGVYASETTQATMKATTKAMLAEFKADAARPFSSQAGDAAWTRDSNGRSCTSCHTDSVLAPGRHVRTGKVIEAMAPSVNSQRLTDRKKINKWFLRNCKWTFARECTAQEKGDILLWLSQQ